MGWFDAILQNEYGQFMLILSATILSGIFLHYALLHYIRRLSMHPRRDIDDVLLNIISKPFYVLVIIMGVYLAFRSLIILEDYAEIMDGLAFSLGILLASWVLSRLFVIFILHWLRVRKRYSKAPQLINKLITLLIFATALVIILSHFNVEITPLVATLGVGGLAIGLALQSTLSNFFAGVYIISDRPINVGDYIELEGNVTGFVEDIGWRSTRIRTLSNNTVIIPNGKLSESTITNYYMPQSEMSVIVQVGVDYHSDLAKVEAVTNQVGRRMQETVPGAIRTYTPFIRFHNFGESNIQFSVIMRVEKYVDKYLLTHEFIKSLKTEFDKQGIEISWPVRKVVQGGKISSSPKDF